MTRAADGARLLRFLVADGPIPSSTGRQAWVQNGMAPNDERLLTTSLRRAGITPEHQGRPGTRQTWWWRAPGDDRPIGGEIRGHECTGCRRILNLPGPRLCISTPRCPGHYQPTPWLTNQPQATPPTHRASNASTDLEAWRSRASNASIDLEAWRSRPSPLRTWPVTRRNTRLRLHRWR
jgi:hypothetical protein